MVPHDDFTPHGYLDNPYHSWKINPGGVLRSQAPLGLGWHVPNLGSYARNQFQYTAHLQIGLKIGKTILITPEDFKRHKCTITSHLHTKNRFGYTCAIPKYQVTLTARYFLINEHALGCIITLSTTVSEPLPITCYIMHQHTHNPHTSRLWEHGIYIIDGPQEGTCLLGLASEGDAFVHGARSADGGKLSFGRSQPVISLEEAALRAHDIPLNPPHVTDHEEGSGWQLRTAILPCTLTLNKDETEQAERIINTVLARGVSRDQSYQRWLVGMEEIVRVETDHRADDEQFWRMAPQLGGDWPDHWRRGVVYDLETLRMIMRPSLGVVDSPWDGMQIQAPRLVLAEAAMDVLFLSYANPALAAEVILGHFESAPHPNLPCMREDGSYNMVADDGQICGTAPEWGYPVWCCDQIWKRTGDVQWLRRLYPRVAAYLRWWLENRRDKEGWLVYACSWESGQDVSSRFGPQQTGGTIIQHVRPVDLQASMAQSAEIVARWATVLQQSGATEADFASESAWWQQIANEFTIKTRLMWQNGWFRDYDSATGEWSEQQDTMHLAPIFCGVAGWGHTDQLRPSLAQPPLHSGWAPLSWPPVVMTLIGATAAAEMPLEAAEFSHSFIDAAYRSIDQRELDEHGGLPGITREYHRTVTVGKWGETDYANAGIEGYGWGAVSIHLLMRYILGLREEEADKVGIFPMMPPSLRHIGARYRVTAIQWGNYTLDIECQVRDAHRYHLHISSTQRQELKADDLLADRSLQIESPTTLQQEWEWEEEWGEGRILNLSDAKEESGNYK